MTINQNIREVLSQQAHMDTSDEHSAGEYLLQDYSKKVEPVFGYEGHLVELIQICVSTEMD